MSKELDRYVTPPPADEANSNLETIKTLVRLAVGGAAEGADELLRRLQERQRELNQNHAGNITVSPELETDIERLRYALVGALFEAPAATARGLSRVRQSARRASDLIAQATSPVTNSRLARPARRRYEKLTARRDALLNRLIERGRTEEQAGRLLARSVTTETIDEMLAYLAQKPEIREIVQEQGLSLTGEVVQELRYRTAAADDLLDRVLGRRKPQPPAVVEGAAVAARPPKTKP